MAGSSADKNSLVSFLDSKCVKRGMISRAAI
jgi:hypothetical protein